MISSSVRDIRTSSTFGVFLENLTGLRKSYPSGTTAKPVRFI
jgi:hypothetical protein